MSTVSLLSLHRLESLQQLFVKFQHNRRIVSKQPKATRYDVFIVAFSQLTGEKEIPWEMFCPRPGNSRCLAGARRRWRPGAGAGRPRLSLGVAGCQKITPCSEGRDATTRLHLTSNAITCKLGAILGKTRSNVGAVPCPLSGWSLAKTELCSGQESLVWEDDPIYLSITT